MREIEFKAIAGLLMLITIIAWTMHICAGIPIAIPALCNVAQVILIIIIVLTGLIKKGKK